MALVIGRFTLLCRQKPNIPSPRLVNGSMSPWRSSAAGRPQTQICWTKSTPGVRVERPSAESSHQLSRSSMSVRESYGDVSVIRSFVNGVTDNNSKQKVHDLHVEYDNP